MKIGMDIKERRKIGILAIPTSGFALRNFQEIVKSLPSKLFLYKIAAAECAFFINNSSPSDGSLSLSFLAANTSSLQSAGIFPIALLRKCPSKCHALFVGQSGAFGVRGANFSSRLSLKAHTDSKSGSFQPQLSNSSFSSFDTAFSGMVIESLYSTQQSVLQ